MLVLLIILATGVAWLSRGTPLFTFAVANAAIAFWANGVMANYTRADADECPRWAAVGSMLTAIGTVVLGLIYLAVR